MSHTQINYAFLLFWSIFGEIYIELPFLVNKVAISERSTEILRKFVLFFLTCFLKVHILNEIWICLNNGFWLNHWKGTNIKKNCFSPQGEPHTDKRCFSVILKHFRGNSQRTSLFSPKSDSLWKEQGNTQKICFS